MGSVLARLLLDDNIGSAGYNADTGKNSSRRRPLRVALVEARPSPPSLNDLIAQNNSQAARPTSSSSRTQSSSSPPDPRAYALSPTSLSYLGPRILQSLLQQNRIGIYDHMQVWEHDGPAQLHFVGEDLCNAIQDGRLVDLNAMIHGSHDAETDDDNGRNWKNKNATITSPWLGAVIEDAPLVSSLWDELRLDTRIDFIDNAQITSIDAPSPQEVGNAVPPPPVQCSFIRQTSNDEYKNNEDRAVKPEDDAAVCTITSNLLVAADGANSFVRRTIGNFPMTTHSYGRKAVTCTVQLEYGLRHTAYQRFLPHGPIALLPVRNGNNDDDGRGGGDDAPVYANVVWSTTPTHANRLLALSPSEFVSTLNHHLRQGPTVNPSILPKNNMIASNIPLASTLVHELDSLLRTANSAITMGTWTESPSRNHFRLPPKSIDVVSPIMGFDLTMSHVSDYTYASRVALVGDAAHTMHPMAGQGLNLGLDDVSSLAKLIKEAIDCGMDVGGTSLFLDRYNTERLVKGWGILGGVHGLHETFGCSRDRTSAQSDLLQDLLGYSRSLGMNLVNGLPIVRQTLAEVAAGATPPFSK